MNADISLILTQILRSDCSALQQKESWALCETGIISYAQLKHTAFMAIMTAMILSKPT